MSAPSGCSISFIRGACCITPGQMWKGLENAQLPVAPGGKLFIAIYNDTGTQAARWLRIKKIL